MVEFGNVAIWFGVAASIGSAIVAGLFAARSVKASQRSAAAAERRLELDTRPRWRIEFWGGTTWLLINDSPEKTYAVTVIVPADLGMRRGETRYGPVDLDPDGSVEFDAAAHMNTRDDRVVVTWHRRPDHSDDQGRWERKLPQRPSR